MTPIALQITLPEAPELSPGALATITGRTTRPSQAAWLKDHGWVFELTAGGDIVVGSLYAHLRLAGLLPTSATTGAPDTGFSLDKTR